LLGIIFLRQLLHHLQLNGLYCLKFSDEFNVDGAPDAKWSYDLGAGGWGNSESQSYTSAADNVSVAGGNELLQKKVGSSYTG
jgi:hypothetical protein